ncbi:hypothetical protein DL770_004636 [Monosporascus sp. CRB-9-2]|nr:hypothetical protein DL770_004636 [Monosporascus sp. CRB-9-2]
MADEEKKATVGLQPQGPASTVEDGDTEKRPWWHSVKEAGSAAQIIIAAIIAIAIGMAVVSTVEEVPQAAIDILGIPGNLWLRSLQAVVLPLICTAIIIAIQRLKEMSAKGAKLAKWTIWWYIGTTLLAIVHSTILTGLVWSKQFQPVSEDSLAVSEEDQETIEERREYTISQTVVNLFESFITDNIVSSFADSSLLAVLVMATVVGFLLKREWSILKAVHEIEAMTTVVITFLIKCAPIGVFFLILPNLFQLNLATMGANLGFLIAGALVGMLIHLGVVLPALYFIFARENPYAMWIKCSPAWITAWGSASSAATLPVTIRTVRARGVCETVARFTCPLGCLINMDGTAIYFPVVVVFLAETQGMSLNPAQYVIVCLLSTLASIGTTPIPSSSLVLTVMIAQSVNVPVTGMYAVVVAIDWFLDRFRTATNVSGDLLAARVLEKQSGIKDDDDYVPDDTLVEEVTRGENRV